MELVFGVLSIIAIAGAVGVVFFRQPVHSGISFMVTIIALAGLFALLSASFLFMVQIILYAGAVITLILFVIMVLNVQNRQLPDERGQGRALVFGALCLVPFVALGMRGFESLGNEKLVILGEGFGGIHALGLSLFKEWVLPFELISLLLLVALVGAVVLLKKESA